MSSAKRNTQLVWILSDNKSGWVDRLIKYGFVKATPVGERRQSAETAIALFTEMLKVEKPKYAIFSFSREKGSSYAKALESFMSICKENGVIPVLTTYLEGQSKTKNALTLMSGEKYIDFAELSTREKICSSRGYTKLGVEAVCAKVLSDFPEIITPDIKIRKGGASLPDGGKLSLGANKVRDGKFLVLTAKIDGELKDGEKILFGHGHMESYSRWVEITNTDTVVSTFTSWATVPHKERIKPHGLKIKNFITAIITADLDGVRDNLYLITDGGFFHRDCDTWTACQGEIFVSAAGFDLPYVDLAWTCEDYTAPIWFVGASYFSLCDPARWPYYMYADDYKKRVFITGRGGMNGINGREEIADALKYGKPEYMVWGVGMNDGPDVDGDINPKTYENKTAFLKICKEHGIKPLFMTIPNCGNENNQKNDNTYKLDYVNNRRKEFADYDYRVVDISHAVNGIEPHAPWYDHMLHTDGTHPTALGARNFYLELLCEFPELMLGTKINTLVSAEKTLDAGKTLEISNPGATDEYAITFKANFDGEIDGNIEIGSREGSKIQFALDKISVYKNGEKTFEIDNKMNMKDIFMARVHVVGRVANIALVSSGEKDYDPKNFKLFKFECDFDTLGEVYAVADKTALVDADLKYTVTTEE